MTSLECRLLDACNATYAIKHGALDPKNPFLQPFGLKAGTEPVVFVDGKENINAGFVAETEDDWVVVALRGTLPPFKGHFLSWLDDWLQDFEAGPSDWIVNGRKFGQVETGFKAAVMSVMPDIRSALSRIDLHSKKGILVTGHSKGAAMTFLVTSLLKANHVDILVENCCFAAPMTCDREFQKNYDALGLAPLTVRYQNMYDIVPFLPWWPSFAMLASAERRATGGPNKVVTERRWRPFGLRNEYVDIGRLRYLGPDCVIQTGSAGEDAAWSAMKHALEHLEFETIVDAHSSDGRYYECVCGGKPPGPR